MNQESKNNKISTFLYDTKKRKMIIEVVDVENGMIDLVMADGVFREKLNKSNSPVSSEDAKDATRKSFKYALSKALSLAVKNPELQLKDINIDSFAPIFSSDIAVFFNAEGHQIHAEGDGDVLGIFSVIGIFFFIILVGDKKITDIEESAFEEVFSLFEREKEEYYKSITS